MGWGGSLSGAFSQDRSKETGTSNKTTNTSYDRSATFLPQGQQTLNSLGGFYGGAAGQAAGANNFYQQQLSTPGGVNPYAQQVVDSTSKVADTDFKNRLAQVRSGGFRGGQGRDTINQSKFASDFTNQQQAQNAQTLLNAFQQQQGEKFASAQGLANNQTQAQQFLALLRGETGDQQSTEQADWLKYGKNQGTSYAGKVQYAAGQ
jgi:hypothetical protein